MIAGSLEEALLGGNELQPVRLVLLRLMGSREGENDFIDFATVEDALVYGRQIHGEPRFQLEAIENASGRSILAYDELNELCRSPYPISQRRRAVGE